MQSSDLLKIEESVLNKWNSEQTRKKANDLNQGKKIFFFLEGPPYANGELHMGHIRGYARKDAILRYKRMKGYSVFDRGGFDVHGLPTENKVERQLGVVSKKDIEAKIGVRNFINKCIESYKGYVKEQISDALKYGVWFDFDNAYIPASPEYIEKSIEVFKKIYDKGLVYKAIQVMPYCMHCGTVLAKGPEVEEQEDTDPSVYAIFKISTKMSKPRIAINDNTYLFIWTTTPWTLPANMAVAVNPKALYVKAKIGGREVILAKERLDAVASEFNLSPVVIAEFPGSELDGIYYSSPFEELVPKQKELKKYHRVIFSEELVGIGDGTGMVHIAPAYGPEDFMLAKKEKIPILSIVDNEGRYNADAGKYANLQLIHDANREIEKELEVLKAMIGKGTIKHSYPHCWRCKEKLIFLPTEQWFINIAKIKNKIKKACEKIDWHPIELKNWFIESIETAPDWVISRQRYWDIPIPIWLCGSCDNIKVVGSFKELNSGSKKLSFTSEDLHKPAVDEITFKCEKCGGEMRRIKDVFDVWYDSGVAHTASLSEKEFAAMFPKAFITEGPDQIRGWFATLMKTGIAAYGKSPFNSIVMQGWVVDAKGEAMHKSKGNYVAARDPMGKYSLDAVRCFVLSHVTHENLKFSFTEVEEFQSMILLLHNILNLIEDYSATVGYAPNKVKRPSNIEKLDPEDAWIVSKLNTLTKNVTENMERYEVYDAITSISNFIVNDLSRFYLKLAKKKILGTTKKRARNTIDTINYVLFNSLLLLAPIAPFNTEDIYGKRYKNQQSIFFEKWPKPNENLVNKQLEENFMVANDCITAILNSREKAQVKLRWPLREATLELSSDSAYDAAQRLTSVIEDYTNIKSLKLKKVEGVNEEVKPLFAKIGPEFKENAGMVAEALKQAKPEELRKSVDKSGYYALHTQKGVFEIKPEHFVIIQKSKDSDAVEFKYGKAYVNKEIDDELKEEAMVREFERAVQVERKNRLLKKTDKIRIFYETDISFTEIINRNLAKIKKSVNAKKIEKGIKNESQANAFEIEEGKLKVQIEKIEG